MRDMTPKQPPNPIDRPGRRVRRDGFGMIDCLVSVVVISLSSFGFLAASMSATSLDIESRTIAAANRLTRVVLEEMQAAPIDELLARYNADPTDDPDGAGTARGDSFELDTTEVTKDTRVVEIDDPNCPDEKYNRAEDSISSIPEKMDCKIVLPTTTVGGTSRLRENTVAPELGLPADLNGDGKIDGVDHDGDYQLLPVQIRIEWPAPDGSTRFLQFTSVLGGRGRA